MDALTGFQRDLLYVIANFDEPSGQTVGSELQEYYESELITVGFTQVSMHSSPKDSLRKARSTAERIPTR